MDKLSITPFPDLPERVPYALFPDLLSVFISPDAPYDTLLELVVTIEGEEIPAREFAEYLALIDRIYGRLSLEGLRSYAHKEQGRLQIAEIHKSELEVIFRVLQAVVQEAATYIVIAYALKTLSEVIKINTESYKNLVDARKSLADARKSDIEAAAIREEARHKEIVNAYEEGRLARENRKHIREFIQQDPDLMRLDDARKSQLTALLDALFTEENARLAAPIRFAKRHVKNVKLRTRKREGEL
jgi:hypothetical protein